MPLIYSDEDQKLIDESLERIKEFETSLLFQLQRLGLGVEEMRKELLDNKQRVEMHNLHTKLVMTRIPVGFK